ncbi:hypothetical protein H8R23_04820 [Flavobacterium sp. F-380]|jgi:hypothetical protein|uniref:Alpha-ketoglutarate decarboxylase n=1 Tax=Flavobacterium kayseriense TaxID=2764714 RepID=A0ABR7J596_9FLAO|nr:hypothetical protein [Flavobacterium kayseriense]MBC5840720.1 hypothetical protein [Flavobacterium kayseriense]MBC5846610.1 hypothetical protein [Flavobacterium kayseriense]MBU0941043.1 hypothetical protein [Bacteroidota bacterium]
MSKNNFTSVLKAILIVFILFISNNLTAQQQSFSSNSNTDFWNKVQFGGGLGLSLGSGYTDISVAPSAIYNFNEYVAMGVGLQYTYASQRNFYTSNLYGGSIIALFNPIPEIQLSAELEQLRVNLRGSGQNSFTNDFWNTGLFLGAGYRTGNVTLGARYNVLFKEDKGAYSDAFMPFVRVYF